MLAGLVFLVAAPSAAFKGAEHRQLSNLALNLALEHLAADQPGLADELRAELLTPSKLAERASFGDLTRAVDYVFHPEKLVPDPRDCGADLGIPTVCAACEPDPSGEQCRDAILDETTRRLRTKRVRYLNRLLAAHRNQSHFDRGAMETYNALHTRALEQAGAAAMSALEPDPGSFAIALRTEAVALHFLEDFFSAGHAITRRGTHDDIASLSMHGRYNRKGLQAEIGTYWRDSGLLETARRLAAEGGLAPVTRPGEDDVLGLDPADAGWLAGFPDAPEPRFYGDGRLATSGGRPQLGFLLLMTAASVLEVLEAGGASPGRSTPAGQTAEAVGDSARRLALCYRGWSAEPKRRTVGRGFRMYRRVRNTAGAEAVRDWPELTSTCRPWAAAILAPATGWGDGPCWEGVLGEASTTSDQEPIVLGAYPYPACPEVVAPVPLENYVHWTPGISLGSSAVRSRSSEIRARTDLDFLISAVTPAGVHRRLGQAVLPGTFLQGESTEHFLAQLFFVGLSYEEQSDLETLGASYGGQIPWRSGRLHFNQYLRWDVGLARYRASHLDSIKPRLGLRIGVGLGFLFLEAGVERAHANDRQAHLEWTTRYSLGVRAQYPLPALRRSPR